MGRISIREEAFPEIIGQYNSGGKTAAYDCLRSRYGIKHPYFVMKRIKELLPDSPPYFGKDQWTDKPARFFVNEIIREKILLYYDKEIP